MGILAFFNGLFLRLMGLVLAGVLGLSSFSVPRAGETFEAQDPDNLRLSISVFADLHMQGFFWSQFRLPMQNFYQLASSLRDINGAQQPVDALVLLGDNTQNGQVLEYIWLYSLLQRYNRVPNLLAVLGNHDLNLNALNYRTAINRHNFFWRSYDRTRATQAFYSREINGYTLIALAGEGPDCERHISDAQLAWLAGTMENAAPGKPIFVFVHQHMNVDFPRPEYFPRAAEVRAILEQYDNVFVFNGHWHHWVPLGVSQENGVHYVNIPGLHSHVNYDDAGEGLQIEVYDNHVALRFRNFMAGEWLDDEFLIELI